MALSRQITGQQDEFGLISATYDALAEIESDDTTSKAVGHDKQTLHADREHVNSNMTAVKVRGNALLML